MASPEPSSKRFFVVLFAVLLIGPVMFIASRYLSVASRYEKVNVGDSVATVKDTMGPPDEQTISLIYPQGDVEYHYRAWPVPKTWVVSFKDGKVVNKTILVAVPVKASQ